MGPTALLPLRRKALAGFEPANLGTRDQHANHYTTVAAQSKWLTPLIMVKADTGFAIPDVDGCLKVVTESSPVLYF
jgi:hypothetical protein